MTKANLSKLSIDELLEQYVDLSVREGQALYLLQPSSKVNRLVRRIFEIDDELQQRPGDQRIVLRKLFCHPDDWVRYNAANALLHIVPTEARPVIQAIAESRVFPQAGHAGMTLSFYDGPLADLSPRNRGTRSSSSD